MRQQSERSNFTKQSSELAMFGSQHEPSIIKQGDNLLVDARLLHNQLGAKSIFATWIKRRIEEFAFEEGKDFFPNLEKSKTKPITEYHLTLDMAKELAMLERNEVGRAMRRYFIAMEKKAKGGALPLPKLAHAENVLGSLKALKFNNRKMYVYREVLRAFGYNTTSGGASQRKKTYGHHFVNFGDKLYITEEFAKHLAANKALALNREVIKAMPAVIPSNFGEQTNLLH